MRSFPFPKEVVDELLEQLSEARAEVDQRLAATRREFETEMNRLHSEVEEVRQEMRRIRASAAARPN